MAVGWWKDKEGKEPSHQCMVALPLSGFKCQVCLMRFICVEMAVSKVEMGEDGGRMGGGTYPTKSVHKQ